MNLTINEIARLAQVSKGTVSKVLNNYSGVSDHTRKKIQKVIKQMGYEANSSAKALAMKCTGNIGLVIPHDSEHSLNGDYWSSLVTSITQEASTQGYNILLLLPAKEGKLDDLFSSITRKRQMDGLVVGAEFLNKKHIATLMLSETPFAMVGRNPEFTHHYVDIDNRRAANEITRYIQGKGYQNIMFVGGPEDLHYSKERYLGYKDAMTEYGSGYLAYLHLPYYEHRSMQARLREALQQQQPDAVLIGAGGGFMFDTIAVLDELGLHAPEFGMATFDDYQYLNFIRTPITAVSQPIHEIGHEVVRLLTKLIHFPAQVPPPNVLLNTSIVPRKSCGE